MWTDKARAAAAAARKSSGLKGGTLLTISQARGRKNWPKEKRKAAVMNDFRSRRTARALVKHMQGE